MLIEILVLGRDEGVDDAGRDRGDRHVDAPLARELGDQRAVIGVDAGHHRRLVFGEHLVVGQFARHLPQHEGRGASDGDEDDHRGGEHEAEEAQEKPATTAAPPLLRRLDWSSDIHVFGPVPSLVLIPAGHLEATLAKIMATKQLRRRKAPIVMARLQDRVTSEGISGDAFGEIDVDRFDDRSGGVVAPRIGGQMLLVVGVARGIRARAARKGCPEPSARESRPIAISACAASLAGKLADDRAREHGHRAVLRLALGKIDREYWRPPRRNRSAARRQQARRRNSPWPRAPSPLRPRLPPTTYRR